MSSATFSAASLAGRRLPNVWDIAAILFVFAMLIGIAEVARGTFASLSMPEATAIHLDPSNLPYYAARTVLRMFAAMAASLLFTFTYATWAAKSRRAGMILVPMLDVLQSVPILGFLSFTVVFFMNLFPGRVLGAELASIFAIFTSQAWNMAFSFYYSLTSIPADLDEAARGFRLTGWQRFWRLEVPFALPGLIWNMMISMSGGWFFVVASEAIAVGNTTWKLPGVGSYVAEALQRRDIGAVGWAIFAMAVVILLYDQLLFRPLVAWSAKFRFETTAAVTASDPWLLKLVRRTHLLRVVGEWLGGIVTELGGLPLRLAPRRSALRATPFAGESRSRTRLLGDIVWVLLIALFILWAVRRIGGYVAGTISWPELGTAVLLGGFTALRVVAMIALASLIWVPIGVWLGMRPAWARRAQPLAQFLAAFPANLLFPPFVLAIVQFSLNPNIWLTPLMVLGTQWYILFNVVAGASSFPGDLREAATNLRVGGWLWWRRVILPAIFPYYVTGALAASGGSWNAAIVAEVASWGNVKLSALGLGAYIAQATEAGDMPRVVLGVAVMSAFVLAFNRAVWRPLYAYANRYTSLG